MPVFRAIGMGIAIVVLKLALPDAFSGFAVTLAQFFQVAGHVLSAIDQGLAR